MDIVMCRYILRFGYSPAFLPVSRLPSVSGEWLLDSSGTLVILSYSLSSRTLTVSSPLVISLQWIFTVTGEASADQGHE